MKPPDAFFEGLKKLEIELTESDLQALQQYLNILLEVNQRFNLTAIREPDQAWMRHVLDSLSLLPFLDDARKILDMGSGGGMPGLILAIIQPERHFTLVDATGKKVRFLQEASAALNLKNVTCIQSRAEKLGQDPEHRERYDMVTARAVGRMNILLEYCMPLIRVEGTLLAMKGAQAEAELRDCGDALMILGCADVQVYETMPDMDDEAVVIIVGKAHATPEEYPRADGLPKSKPLGE